MKTLYEKLMRSRSSEIDESAEQIGVKKSVDKIMNVLLKTFGYYYQGLERFQQDLEFRFTDFEDLKQILDLYASIGDLNNNYITNNIRISTHKMDDKVDGMKKYYLILHINDMSKDSIMGDTIFGINIEAEPITKRSKNYNVVIRVNSVLSIDPQYDNYFNTKFESKLKKFKK